MFETKTKTFDSKLGKMVRSNAVSSGVSMRNGSQQLLCPEQNWNIAPRAKRHGTAYEKKEASFASERGVY
jgi:hypothetical protein